MKKYMAGPRSNFSLLPFELRIRIISLMHDGATYAAVIGDTKVAERLQSLGLTLTPSALSRVKKSAEYRRITGRREEMRRDHAADTLTGGLLKEFDIAGNISESVRVDLLRIVRDCVAANPEDTREVERLVRSAIGLTNTAKDEKIIALEQRIAALGDQLSAAKQREEDLLKRISELEHGASAAGMTEATLSEVEKKIKLL